MQGIQDDGDQDQLARNQAALAAQARARQVAGGIAQAHADRAYQQARQNARGYVPPLLGHVPPPPPGYGLPPLQRGPVIPGVPVHPPPPPPAFAVGAMNALADISTAMTAVVQTLGRVSGNNSRRRDGDVVVNKDISGVFDEVPEDILERVKYVRTVANRLQTNTSGIRYKTDRHVISSIHMDADASVATNFRMYEFKNIDVVVPFAVVFSDTGKDTQIMIPNSDGDDCYVPIPTRILNKLSKQVYSYLFDKIPHSMRMLHADCDKYDGFTLIHRIKTLEKQSLHPSDILPCSSSVMV